ncbi:ComF family protein [Streptomyces sp. NPDC029526]|uniref:ComF family protein n=1 Tax=Streptomyces sp. NPDC029526 TaxID=3155728 RepID=UPI0033C953DA
MRAWWQDLTDLVLPPECGGCARPRTVLCPRCRAVLERTGPRRVRPRSEPPGLPEVHAAARYGDEVRAALLAHKERGALALAAPLGEALAGAVRAALTASGEPAGGDGGGGVLLVPVPSARRAVRARGHDPARRIALAAAGDLRRAGVPAQVLPALRQRRSVADQSELGPRERLANVAGAFGVVPGAGRLLGEGRVVIVDDLMTTGASLAEAARAVRVAMRTAAERRTAVTGRSPSARSGRPGGDHRRAGRPDTAAGAGYGSSNPAPALVYTGETGEGRGQRRIAPERGRAGRRTRRPAHTAGTAGEGRADANTGIGTDGVVAAVVAASPASFEINRN